MDPLTKELADLVPGLEFGLPLNIAHGRIIEHIKFLQKKIDDLERNISTATPCGGGRK